MSFVAFGSSHAGKRELEEEGAVVFHWHRYNLCGRLPKCWLFRDPVTLSAQGNQSPVYHLMNLLLPKPGPYPRGTP